MKVRNSPHFLLVYWQFWVFFIPENIAIFKFNVRIDNKEEVRVGFMAS